MMEYGGIDPDERHHWERLEKLWRDRVRRIKGVDRIVVLKPERTGGRAEDGFLLWGKLQAMMKMEPPYIWLDWDALPITDSLEPLWDLTGQGRVIGVGHQRYSFARRFRDPVSSYGLEAEDYLNSGVLVVGGPWPCEFGEVMARHRRLMDDPRCYPPMSAFYDDMVLSLLWREQGYSFRDPAMGVEWNAWSRLTRLDYEGQGRWSGTTTDDEGNFTPRVKINHYYGRSAKPWNVGCPMWKQAVLAGEK